MATNEERMMILRMVEEDKISAEEGTRLLKALGNDETTPKGDDTDTGGGARYLRVRVTDLVSGQQQVSVNIPLAVVTFGLRFLPDSFGVNLGPGTDKIDKIALQSAIDSGLSGRIVDVTDAKDGQRIEVYLD